MASYLRGRLNAGLRRIAFFIVPASAGFLALGDVIAAALLETGRFTHGDSLYVWGILAGSTVGLLASTLGRLYSSTYYALRDTRTPLKFAVLRVALTTALGWAMAIPLPPALGLDPRWGVAGLTASAGVAGWLEFALLRRTLNRRIGTTGLPPGSRFEAVDRGRSGGGAGWAAKLALGRAHPVLAAALILAPYGAGVLRASPPPCGWRRRGALRRLRSALIVTRPGISRRPAWRGERSCPRREFAGGRIEA